MTAWPKRVFFRRQFEYLYRLWPVFWVFHGARAPIADHGIAVGQAIGFLKAEKLDVRNILLGELPDHLALGVKLANDLSAAAGDKRVAALQSHRRPGNGYRHRPDLFPGGVILHHLVHIFVADQERSRGCHPRPAELQMNRPGRVGREVEFRLRFAGGQVY